ncbi:hypothetical protein ASPWEDRAFT_38645 [Aspergillus wentii DTO 134E9]|uniref:Serine aminopeptidase S33 domain-containing protein n=1 Tax=Aspergillus wentii DTO 134E9 TaxID=1073089 RepID=A0A1L9RPZ9_ASPWE|nr:uncharacterized protein ASPWEDRAFT_38645 [Aspergillus wentii DTO 134E9]OJJ37009.1 hypothetical protein ASPWEDRAFT_38645 [Aspergillus wentii DTO 134E9]
MMLLSLILTLSSVSLSVAKPAANFNASTSTLTSLGCDSACQRVFSEGQKQDVEMWEPDFDFDFYATARNFSSSKPGDLLKFQPLNGSSLSVIFGLTAYRYQYTSRSMNGSVVPATGFIAIPYSSYRQDGKYPVVAYAHGTIGIFAGCPPSSTAELYDYNNWGFLAQNGYAIVATDYAGLGNNYIEHEYCSFSAHANDIYYGMLAARKVFPDTFTDDWAGVGHSQGGGAVWKLSESALVKSGAAGNYVGTVAIAPGTKMYDLILLTAEKIFPKSNYSTYYITYIFLWMTTALRRAIPSADISFFAQKLLDRAQIAKLTQSCYNGALALGLGLSPKEMITSTAALRNSTDFQNWQKMVSPAMGSKTEQPLLIVQGLNDTTILPQITINSFHDTCKYGSQAHLSLYPGMDHGDVLTASSPEWTRFLRERFEGKSTSGGCKKTVNAPFDATHMTALNQSTLILDL